jgi:hypothetical protein
MICGSDVIRMNDECASFYWCIPLYGSVHCKRKMALSQLTFEESKWIHNCYWKTENVTGTEALKKWIWNLVLAVVILNIGEFKYKIL